MTSDYDRRDFARVDDLVAFEFSVIDDKEVSELAPRFITPCTRQVPGFATDHRRKANLGGDINPRVAAYLQEIEKKLDFLISYLVLEKEEISKDRRPANISASGMRFETGQDVSVGALIDIKLMLPMDPPVVMSIPARVVRASRDSGPEGFGCYDVAVRFVNMTDEVRSEIVRYSFKRQGELYAAGSGQCPGGAMKE